MCVKTWLGALTGGLGRGGNYTHCGIFILERNVKVLHSVDRHPQAIENVVEDDDSPFLLLVL
jgi:hypothetical protein